MMRLIGAVALLALATANPIYAQDRDDDERPAERGKQGNNRDDDGDRSGDDQGEGRRDWSNARSFRNPGEMREGDVRRAVAERGDFRRLERDRDDDDDGSRDRRDDWESRGDWNGRGRVFASVPGCPPGLAKKNNGCLPPGLARQNRDGNLGYEYRPALFGIPLRTRADYVYYDGYLVPSRGSGLSYIPLLGGALAAGRMWPQAYPTLQLADWQRGYYGFDDPRGYRYADNVVYRVDPETAAIEAVAALLTGNEFAVGQRMPLGYDVYNVPGSYQDRYYDTDNALYRYADGRVYEIDPTTMLIAKAIDLVV